MEYIKKADITPLVVLAGDSLEFKITVIIGKDFVTEGSRILLDFPGYMGYSRPTIRNPEDPGYIEVFSSNPDVYFNKNCWNINNENFETAQNMYGNNHAQRIFVLDFFNGCLQEGDELTFIWGFTREGFGQGTKVTTLVLSPEFYNTIHLRYFIDGKTALPDRARSYKGYIRPLADEEIPLSYRIIPREPDHIRLIQNESGGKLLILDRFSNICQLDTIDHILTPVPKYKKNSMGIFIIQDIPDNIKKMSISANCIFSVTANPMSVFEDYSIYFGDLHTHSVFSHDCIEREKMTMTPDAYYHYAKEASCLDFLAVTDHHIPWGSERRKIGRQGWEMSQGSADKHTVPGEFLAFGGFETKDSRGDTTLILGESFTYEEIDDPELKDLQTLWERYKGRNYIGIPHFHNKGILDEGEWNFCPYEGVEPVVEISSCHGIYETTDMNELQLPLIETSRKDRCGRAILDQGYKYGFVCNSDGHKGNPGQNGLTAVFAKELTKESILEGIRKRHTYGTTNARIQLIYTINGLLMGSVIPSQDKKEVFISVTAEDILSAVDVIAQGKIIKRFRPKNISFTVSFILENIEEGYCYIRVIQKDGHRAFSSAIWFE